jgi:hypothetical protein
LQRSNRDTDGHDLAWIDVTDAMIAVVLVARAALSLVCSAGA